MADQKEETPFHKARLGLPDNVKAREIYEARRKALRQDMAKVFTPVEGRRVLRHLMSICGYRLSKTGGNPSLGMDILTGTLYNSARENICIEFLEDVPKHILKDIEYGPDSELDES